MRKHSEIRDMLFQHLRVDMVTERDEDEYCLSLILTLQYMHLLRVKICYIISIFI